MRDLSQTELEMVATMGALHYTPNLIADNLDGITADEVRDELKNPESPIAKAYMRGHNRSQFIIDAKILERAQKGDLEALKELQRRQREIELRNPPLE